MGPDAYFARVFLTTLYDAENPTTIGVAVEEPTVFAVYFMMPEYS